MMLSRIQRFLSVALCVFLAAAGALAGQQAATENPYTSVKDIAAGEKTFRSYCTICHGRTGEGAKGPDLTLGLFRNATSDAAMFSVIRYGIPGTDMPRHYMSDAGIWQVATYVRSLSARSSTAEVAGDPVAGARIFHEQENCSQCHAVDGRGERRAPDLTEVGWRRSPDYLRASLVDPNADVPPKWWTLRLVDGDGTTVTGWRLNEDTYSVRLLDANDNLRAFEKGDLRELERIETSPMMSYEDMLSEQELDDLVAYLYSLRSNRP